MNGADPTVDVVDRSGCAATRHGTRAAYKRDRCRCADARRADRNYKKRLYMDTAPPLRSPVVGSMRRLRALAALGWSSGDVAARLGCDRWAVERWRRGRNPTIYASSAARIVAVYDELSMTVGASSRTRLHARDHGWAPPLAWEGVDIDDPAANPHPDTRTPRRRGDPLVDLADIDHFRGFGMSFDDIAARYGITRDALDKRIARAREHAAAGATPAPNQETAA